MPAKKQWPPKNCKFIKFGSVEVREYQRGRKYYLRWRVHFEDDNGNPLKQWSPWRTFAGKKLAAEAEAERYRDELGQQLGLIHLEQSIEKWADAFHEMRLKESRKPDGKIKESSVERSVQELNRVKKYFGEYTFPGVTAGNIINTFRAMRDDDMSMSIIYKTRQYLSQVLDYGIGEICIDDPTASIINPCSLKNVKAESRKPKQKKREALTYKEVKILAKYIRDNELTGYTVNTYIVLATGFRRGEGLGLSRRDVDLDEKVITPKYQWAERGKLTALKTDESAAMSVPIDETTVQLLARWFEQQNEYLRNIGVSITDETPVCTNKLGGRISPSNFNRWRRKFFVDLGLGKWTDSYVYERKNGSIETIPTGYIGKDLHSLRHTQSTLLVAEGEDIKTVQSRLRHSSSNTTYDVYTHTVKGSDRRAAEIIGHILADEEESDSESE